MPSTFGGKSTWSFGYTSCGFRVLSVGPPNLVAGVAGIAGVPLGAGAEMLVTPWTGGGNTPVLPMPVPPLPVPVPPAPVTPAVPREPAAPVVARGGLGLNVHANELAMTIPMSTPFRQSDGDAAREDTRRISFMGVAPVQFKKGGRNVRVREKTRLTTLPRRTPRDLAMLRSKANDLVATALSLVRRFSPRGRSQ